MTADEVANIPLNMVIDAISEAARNVAILLRRDIANPPVPIHSERKQGDADVAPKEDGTIQFDFEQPESTVEVYEVWKVFLDDTDTDLENVFVVLSADFTTEGYRNGDWSDIEYRGFYLTEQEAINEIQGHLR